jgi:hypothetical protein
MKRPHKEEGPRTRIVSKQVKGFLRALLMAVLTAIIVQLVLIWLHLR